MIRYLVKLTWLTGNTHYSDYDRLADARVDFHETFKNSAVKKVELIRVREVYKTLNRKSK